MKIFCFFLFLALGLYCAAGFFVPYSFGASCSGDNGTAAGNFSGMWSTIDSCFPDAPLTMAIEQEGALLTLTSTLASESSCNGTLQAGGLELNCRDAGSSAGPYALTGTVVNDTTIALSYPAGAEGENSCVLTRHEGLDPMVEQMLKVINISEAIKPMGERTPRQMRRYMARMGRAGRFFPAAPVDSVKNLSFPGPSGNIPVRIYTPAGRGPFPVVLFYHGGGWVVGNSKMFDHYCRLLASQAGALVVSVDYRLAPEHVFPAALEDAYAALEWVEDNAASIGGDPLRIAVAGESAGANLAAVVCLLARDRGGPAILLQVLMCPVTDVHAMATASYSEFAEGYFLTKEWMEAFRGFYLPDTSDWSDPRVSPLLAGTLAGLPPALVITASHDVLRDEGEAYARRLYEAGVPTKHYRCGGVIHGFATGLVDFLEQSKDATGLTARVVGEVF